MGSGRTLVEISSWLEQYNGILTFTACLLTALSACFAALSAKYSREAIEMQKAPVLDLENFSNDGEFEMTNIGLGVLRNIYCKGSGLKPNEPIPENLKTKIIRSGASRFARIRVKMEKEIQAGEIAKGNLKITYESIQGTKFFSVFDIILEKKEIVMTHCGQNGKPERTEQQIQDIWSIMMIDQGKA